MPPFVWIPALVLIGFGALWLFLIAPGRAGSEKSRPFYGRNIAHRGLYDNQTFAPENTLAAFDAAVASGYGVELDVQLSADGEVVVCHDDTLDRVCGFEKRVDACTMTELGEVRIFDSPESVPAFSAVLSHIGGKVPVIVELKHGKHDRELCEKTLSLLRSFPGEYCIESFDPRIVAFFRKHAGDILRGILSQPTRWYQEAGFGPLTAFSLGNLLWNVIARPEFIAYRIGEKPVSVRIAEKMGALRVSWTSREEKNEKDADVVIFEGYRPGVRYKTLKNPTASESEK